MMPIIICASTFFKNLRQWFLVFTFFSFSSAFAASATCVKPLHFSDLVQHAEFAPTLLAAESLYEAAVAGKYEAMSFLGPQLNLQANTERHHQLIHRPVHVFSKFPEHSYQFTLSQKLADLPTFFKAMQAYEEEKTESLRFYRAYQDWYLNVGKAYLDWIRILAELKTKNLAIKTKEEALKEQSARFDLGLVPKSNYFEAKADLDTAIAAKSRIIQAQKAVISVLQGALGFKPCLPDNYQSVEVDSLRKEELTLYAEPLKLDYQILLQESKALGNALKQAESAIWPSVEGFFTKSYAVSGGGRFGDFQAHEEVYGLNLSWSLFTSGGQLAAIKKFREIKRAKELEARALRQSIIAEEESLVAQLKAQEAVLLAEVAREKSAKNLRDTKAEEYRLGLDTQLAFLLADNAWLAALEGRETAKIDWLKLRLEWLLHLNALNEERFTEIESLIKLQN